MRKNVLLVASLMVLMVPLESPAQEKTAKPSAMIEAGDTVRLTAKALGTRERVGIVTKVADGKMFLRDTDKNGAAWEIPTDKLNRIEVRRLDGGNQLHKSALVGMISGFVGFGVVGYVASLCGGCEFEGVGVVLAAPGGGLGALLGALYGRSQKVPGWQRVTDVPVKVGFAPAANGKFRLSGSIAF